MQKTLVVVGVTGNQGGSVVERFLQDPQYHVRGLTRDPTSDRAQQLAGQGIEMVQATLDDVESLKKAFAGANLIFTVSNYWEPFLCPDCRQKAIELGVTCRRYAYNVEYQQGKNMADAAAITVDTLDDNGFVASTLSHAGKCSDGTFEKLCHFDTKADAFSDYVRNVHPVLAKKMSCVHTGYFMSSYRLAPQSYFVRVCQGMSIGADTLEMRLTRSSLAATGRELRDAFRHFAVKACTSPRRQRGPRQLRVRCSSDASPQELHGGRPKLQLDGVHASVERSDRPKR